MKKRVVAVLMAAAMAIGMLAGCGAKEEEAAASKEAEESKTE